VDRGRRSLRRLTVQKLVYAIAFVMAIVAPPQPLGIGEPWQRTEVCSVSRRDAKTKKISVPRRLCVKSIQIAL
jgi:hypothetical protein